MLKIGDTCTVHSLNARPELNGRRCVVVELTATGRVGVRVEGEDKLLALKRANLVAAGPEMQEAFDAALLQRSTEAFGLTSASPPAAVELLRMGVKNEVSALSAAVAKWAVGDKEVAQAVMGAVSLVGARNMGPDVLDELVTSNQGAFLPAFIKALTIHSDGGMLTLAGLAALGSLSTGGGDAAWKESPAGTTRCHVIVKHGAFDAIVPAMNHAGFSDAGHAWEIQKAGLHAIASLCFGHDGRDGFGPAHEACERREVATKAGAIEAIVNVMRASIVRDPPKPADTREILVLAHRALTRVTMGFSKAGAARREQAVAADAIPAYVAALDRFFSRELLESTAATNMVLMRQSNGHRADPFLDKIWQSELTKRPSLEARVQNEMVEVARADPQAIARVRKHNSSDVDLQNQATMIERAARQPREAPIPPGQYYKDEDEKNHIEREIERLRNSAPARANEPSSWAELVQDSSFQAEIADIRGQDDLFTYMSYLKEKNPRRLAFMMQPDIMVKLNDLLNRKLLNDLLNDKLSAGIM